MSRVDGIIRARRLAADSLCVCLRAIGRNYTEAELASAWLSEIRKSPAVFPSGWYQPPPGGVSVLVGAPPGFDRLEYRSLRQKENWPSGTIAATEESIIYPYLSVVDRRTGMIGDFVGTFYSGKNPEIRSWIAAVYRATRRVAAGAVIGQRLCELYELALAEMASLGGRNNTFSISGDAIAGSDIGHTVPGYAADEVEWLREGVSESALARSIADARTFVNAVTPEVISKDFAFTIEPQMVHSGLPMASFHIIVAFDRGRKHVIEGFDNVFECFGMDSWIAP